MPHCHHFSICNQNQSISILVIFGQNTKAIPLLFGQKCLIFITFQSAIKINQFQFWAFLAKIPRLEPYFLAKNASLSSLFNLQSKSINFNFGHFWPRSHCYSLTFWPKMPHCHHFSICNQNQSISILVMSGQNTTAIALVFGQKCLIFITFQSAIKINQFQFWSFLARIPRLQPYFLAKNTSLSSLFNLQSKSINFKFGHFWPKYQGYSLTFWPKMPHCHHFSMCNENQSNSILVIIGQNTKPIALLVGQKCLICITFQSAIKINQCQFWAFLAKIPRLQPYFLAKNASLSSLFNLQSKSINFNCGHFWPKYQGYSLTFWPKMPHCHHFSICNQNQSISILVIFGQNTKAIPLLFGQKCLIFITFQSAIKINQFQFWAFLAKIPRLQPYFLAKNASLSSLFNLQSKSINFNFGHFWPKYQGYSLTSWPKMPHFHHFSICNQNHSISILVICGQNTKAIALLFGQTSLIFITFQSAIKINQFQFWSFLAKKPRLQPYFSAKNASFSSLFNLQSKSINFNFWSFLARIPRLQPYFSAKNASFSSRFNLQSKSINFNFGHVWPKYQGYSLTFWPTCLIFITFQSAIKINQFQLWSFWPKYHGYSLTFWPTMPHFHHFSICNQNQSISILVIIGQNTKATALLFGQKCLIFITFQSAIKINQFHFLVIFGQNTKAIALLFGQKCLIFITFQSAIKINQFQFLVIFGQNTKAIALLFGQKCLIFITCQSAIKINQFQFWSFLAKIPRLYPYVLAKHASFSSLFNLQSKSIIFNFGHFWPKYQGYSLTFWPNIPHFHHFSICNQNQSISILVIFGQNTKAIALLFGQKCLIFITFQSAIKINQFQLWSFLARIPRLQPYFLAKNASFSSLFNLQSKSINFNCGHFWPKYHGYSLTFWPKMPHFHHFSICNQNQSISILVIFGQNTKAIALLFGQKCLIFITCQSAIKINQYQSWLLLAKIQSLLPYLLAKNASFSSLFNLQSKSINFNFDYYWPKYNAYCLTSWPNIPHCHHFSICNQNQSISILVIFGQDPMAIALLLGQKCLSVITFQSAIKINQFQFLVIFGQNTKAIALLFGQKCLIFITCQSAIKINQFQFWSFLAKIPRLYPYVLAKHASFSSLFHLQSKSIISILVIFGQNTKAIALLFGQTSLIFITFQSAIKINQFQFWSFLAKIPRLQPYFLAKNASFSSLFNLQSKSINFNCGHFWPEYQGYSLTSWPKMPHFHHFSICNQNQSISIVVIFGQNTTAIALRFGQKCLIFITFQSAIKINQFQFWSFLAKIPRLQPYFLAKNASFSSLVNLQSKLININLGYYWPKYKAYCLTCWPKMPHFHHFSICNQNQSISILIIIGQNTTPIASLLGQTSLIVITFQSAIKINQFQFWSFLAKIPWLQPYFLAKNASVSSLFNLQSKSINFNFGHFWPKYQGYSLTSWPKMPHFHHLSICNQSQSISILVIIGQNTKAIPLLFGQKCLIFITFQSAIKINQCQFWAFLAKIPRLQPYFLAKNASLSSLFNLHSKSINFNFGHFWPKYQGYSLTIWLKMPHFHHLSICNQNQSISIVVIFGQNTKAIAFLFGQKCLIFIVFQSVIKINQFQFWSVLAIIPRLQPYSMAKNASLSSLFTLQSKSINFNFGHLWPKYQGYSLTFWPKMPHFHHFSICNQNQSISILVMFGQTTKPIALRCGQKCLNVTTFQSAIKINQFQFWSFLAKIPRLQPYFLAKTASFSSLFNLQSKSINFNSGHFWPRYQGYSLTSWPNIPHFHHFSICNQNQSISILVMSGQNTTAIALVFGQKCLIFITFQSAIKINQFQFWSFLAKIPRLQPYFLAKNTSLSSLFNLQSKSINFKFGHFWPKYQGYSLTFWPKMPHFHHFSMCNENQSISILVIIGQNTKPIALLVGQTCLIFITFQSAIKINQCQFWAFLAKIPRLQPYFLAKNASLSSLFNLQSKSINFNFGHFWPKYQGYSLTSWPKMPHFHHFSICNQSQSISILVIIGQDTKAIALLFGQKCLIFITFQSAIKINQFQSWSVLAKIPRLQPYFLAKNTSLSSLFNLKSKSINFNFGHFWPKYQGYSLTFWPKMPHFHHFSMCNENQSISILVIIGQNTKPIALLLGQTSLIFITFQSAIKINQFQFWSCLAKIPRLQPQFLAKNASFSSLFNLQSKSINFNFGHFWPKYQGYSLTFWPKIPHCHHFSICNQNQSISSLVIFGQNTKAIALRFGQKCLIFITFQCAMKINQFQSWLLLAKIQSLLPYLLAKHASFSSLFNLQS